MHKASLPWHCGHWGQPQMSSDTAQYPLGAESPWAEHSEPALTLSSQLPRARLPVVTPISQVWGLRPGGIKALPKATGSTSSGAGIQTQLCTPQAMFCSVAGRGESQRAGMGALLASPL